jgi:hypothetical protein
VSPATALISAPLVGVALGLSGAFIHASRTLIFGIFIPWGLVLTCACVIACIRAATVLAGRRTAGVLLASGWLAVTLLAARSTSAGDLPLQMTWRSVAYLVITVVIGSAVMVLSPARHGIDPQPRMTVGEPELQ